MNAAIIGGAGKMGRWIARAIRDLGIDVLLIDVDIENLKTAGETLGLPITTDISRAGDGDAVIIAVPIDRFESVVRSLSAHVRPGQIIMDVTSVKTEPLSIMRRLLPECRMLGTHPVFGPGASNFNGHNVILTPSTPAECELAEEVKTRLEKEGARVAVMSPEKHDQLMAAVLGLAHFIAIVAGDTLLSLDGIKQMEAVSGVTFKALLTLIESVLNEDPALYASIQMHLPPLADMQAELIGKAKLWNHFVKTGDRDGFIERMTELKTRLERLELDSAQAYGRLYKLI